MQQRVLSMQSHHYRRPIADAFHDLDFNGSFFSLVASDNITEFFVELSVELSARDSSCMDKAD